MLGEIPNPVHRKRPPVPQVEEVHRVRLPDNELEFRGEFAPTGVLVDEDVLEARIELDVRSEIAARLGFEERGTGRPGSGFARVDRRP